VRLGVGEHSSSAGASSALAAARLSVEAGLPMAGAIILSAARSVGAALWTQDARFEGMDGVQYVSARSDQQAFGRRVVKA
jgi:predicted nucleic acid-binding protein